MWLLGTEILDPLQHQPGLLNSEHLSSPDSCFWDLSSRCPSGHWEEVQDPVRTVCWGQQGFLCTEQGGCLRSRGRLVMTTVVLGWWYWWRGWLGRPLCPGWFLKRWRCGGLDVVWHQLIGLRPHRQSLMHGPESNIGCPSFVVTKRPTLGHGVAPLPPQLTAFCVSKI